MSATLIHSFLQAWAVRTPDAVALIEPASRTTYAELDARANRFAHLFGEHGVEPGDRVVIALDNGLDMVAAYLGAMKAGAVAVPLAGGAKSDRLATAVADCTPRVCVVDPGAAGVLTAAVGVAPPRVDSGLASQRSDGTSVAGASADRRSLGEGRLVPSAPIVFVASNGSRPASVPSGCHGLREALNGFPSQPVAVPREPGNLAAIIYTSGSTGEPRGVMLTHRNFVANAESIVSYLGLTAADRVMCVLPFYYVYGLSLLHTHLAVGGSIVIENRSAFPNVVLASMQQHEVTGFAGVPSTFTLMLHRSNLPQTELPHLRYVTQAGGGMPPARIQEWLDRGPKADFYVMYGATEAAARLTYLPPRDLSPKLGSIGRAIPNVEVMVVDEEGRIAEPGAVGELVARGENISSGYWNNPEETGRRFSSLGYHTGDLGYKDADGYLFLVGRKHDMIKVGANRVGAKEIEDVLHEHGSVHEAAVVGATHDLLGEAPVAFVAMRAPVAGVSDALRAFCASKLAPYKVPVRVVELPELPKLAGSGKVDRATLRGWAAEMRFEAVQ
jgi:acyl-CoA synthetase (AMP-forming)/AMP-acid ligase II